MPRNEDLTLPTLTGQTPYDVKVSIDRLRDYGLNLAAAQDAVEQRLQALASEVAGTQAVLAQQEADKAGLLVAALQTSTITAGGFVGVRTGGTLGGDRITGQKTAAWVPVRNHQDVTLAGNGFAVRAFCERRTANVATSVMVRIVRLPSTIMVTGVAYSADTNFDKEVLTFTPTDGEFEYQLQMLGSNATNVIWGIGQI